MATNTNVAKIKKSFRTKGGEAMKNARKNICIKYNDDSNLSRALRYFAEVTLHNALPVFPALIATAYETSKDNSQKTVQYGEALVYISAAADLHDDVIDHSYQKGIKQTVLGKFGVATTILAGDILLVEGLKKLNEAGKEFPEKTAQKVMSWVTQAIFEISKGETLEVSLRGKLAVKPSEYYEVIELKAVVPELTMKIGAILGNASPEYVEKLGKFGRFYGVVSIIVEEFADLLDIEELRNRLKNECPPLPLIHAMQDIGNKQVLMPLLDADKLTVSIHEKIVEVVFASQEVNIQLKNLKTEAFTITNQLPVKIKQEKREELKNILTIPLKFFETN